MKLVVIGTGYVGLVAGACFAEVGHEVICVENDGRKFKSLQQGNVYFYEPGLEELVRKNFEIGKLKFMRNIADALPGCQVAFIAVGTPEGEDGEADLSYVYNVAQELGRLADHSFIVVDKSTVPVGTHAKVSQIIREELHKRNVCLDIEVVSNPEFLRQGAAVQDFLQPDRVVIGANSEETYKTMRAVYQPVVAEERILCMDPYSAEMTKYAANAFLATKISFINEMSNICFKLGANIDLISKAIGLDHRISPLFLNAGIGYGGSCFPKDVKALIHKASAVGYTPRILESVDVVNQRQKVRLVEKFEEMLENNAVRPYELQIAVWGLSFKPETDDMREAPSRVIIDRLLNMGCNIIAYDPVAMGKAKEIFGNRITYASSALEALTDSNALFVLTEWKEFLDIKPEIILNELAVPIIYDGRNIFNPAEMGHLGFYYASIGRPTVESKNVFTEFESELKMVSAR